MIFKKIGYVIAFVMLSGALSMLSFCGKKGGTTPADPCKTDPTLSVTTTPANGSTEAAAPGPTFPLRVTVSSTMPSSGVTIEVKAHPDGSTTNFFSDSKSTTTKDNDFVITSSPSTIICVVDITVTSRTCGTNKWTGSYRFSKK
jgi:hypothetical protein